MRRLQKKTAGSAVASTLLALTYTALSASAYAQNEPLSATVADEPLPTKTVGESFVDDFHLGGYVRAYSSWNLSNTPETTQNDKGDLSMLRGSVLLDASGKAGPVRFHTIGRVDREYETDYLNRLQGLGAGQGHIMDLYNQGELREAYIEFDATDRLNFKLGKQQVVWGESDFFHAMDVVEGFNSVWAPPTEESDETRKSLILLNAKLSIPEANGSLQMIVRPGLDRAVDIGNTPDIYGGRNAGIFYRGFDGRNIANFDYHHPDGDIDRTTGGVRWAGTVGGLGYSIAYLETFNPNFVINSRNNPYQKIPSGPVGDAIFPKMDVLGVTLNGYSSAVDAVLSTEVAYQYGAAYNMGTGPLIGLNGIKKKNQIRSMLRMDKNIDLSVIGAAKPSLWSVQIFDTWIQNFKESDDLVLIPTYGRAAKKHETVITNIFSLNYSNNNINPTLVLAYDATNGGGFVIPYVDFVMGDHWRLRTEVDYYFHPKNANTPNATDSPTTFGLASNNNQFTLRLTRQF